MFWINKRVLITGGAGVIGRELIKSLCNMKADVICIDKAERPNDLPVDVEYHKINILDISSESIAEFEPEIIFHLAATFERIEESFEFWDDNFNDNILVSHKIIDAAMKCKNLKKFIFPSSYLVYSPNLYLSDTKIMNGHKLNENDNLSPRNLIGSSKYYTEKELDFVNIVNGKFNCISARIFRVYGLGSKDIISRWVRMAIREEELLLYRKENLFDYIYAGDVAKGLIKIAENVNSNEIINLGTGISHRVEEVINILQGHFSELKVNEIDVDALYEGSCADNAKLVKYTHWCPEYSLEAGIKCIVDYEKKLNK